MGNIVWQNANVNREKRYKKNGHHSIMIWLTGLPGSGKSTLAFAIEEKLFERNCISYVLDGDNVRHGLNSDLGFSLKDRSENMRRIGELGKIFIDLGVITLAAFISPIQKEREHVRRLFTHEDFLEIFCNASPEICELRDPKGMYKKARAGEIPSFTGVSSPYEVPVNPDIDIDTGKLSIDTCVEMVINELELRKKI